MESLPAELLAHILRLVPTARGEAYRSGAGWVACELAGYADPPPTALPVTASWRQDEGAQVDLAGVDGSSGGDGRGVMAEGHAGLRELAALMCTSRALHAALSPDIVWAPFLSRLEGRFAAFDPECEDLWIPDHDGPPLQCTDPGRPRTRASQLLVPHKRMPLDPVVTFAKFADEGDVGLVLKRYVSDFRNPDRSGFLVVPPPYRCLQDSCAAAAGPFECTTVSAFREHCASPAHRTGLFAHIYNTTLKECPDMNHSEDALVDPRLYNPVAYTVMPYRRRVALLHAYIVRVGRLLRAPLDAVELGREQGFGFFHNERSRMGEVYTGLADDWEGPLCEIADFMHEIEDTAWRKRCSMAAVAWVAVHDLVLPDFRRRGLSSDAGYADHIMSMGWTDFDVDAADRGQFIESVLDCEDARLNRDDVDVSDDEYGYDWENDSGSGGDYEYSSVSTSYVHSSAVELTFTNCLPRDRTPVSSLDEGVQCGGSLTGH